MEYEIRRSKKEDITVIYRLVCQLEETIFNYKTFQSIYETNIQKEDCFYLVAVNGYNNIIGFISCHSQNLLHHCGKIAEIQELFVEKEFRKSGAGKSLVAFLEKMLLEENNIALEVSAQHKRMHAHLFYEQLGFISSHKKFTKSLI